MATPASPSGILPTLMVACRICASPAERAFEALILRRHRVAYHHCPACGFLQTDEPHWLAEAYAESINVQDTGLVARNLRLAEEVAPVLYCFFDRRGKYVDWAGGYGLFTRLMRDVGFDFRSYDPHTPNLLARGFEAGPDEAGVELVTSFESFEHFRRPLEELERILAISRSVLFSTETLPTPTPAPEAWWYYGLEHGQHVSFYEPRTLEHLARRFGLRLHPLGGPLHLMSERRIEPWRLGLVKKLRRRWLSPWVRRHMRSRTVEDHDRLARRGGPGAP